MEKSNVIGFMSRKETAEGARAELLHIIFELREWAYKTSRRQRGFSYRAKVITVVRCKDDIGVNSDNQVTA